METQTPKSAPPGLHLASRWRSVGCSRDGNIGRFCSLCFSRIPATHADDSDSPKIRSLTAGCPSIEVDVEFAPFGHAPGGSLQDPKDTILKISKPIKAPLGFQLRGLDELFPRLRLR
jgi:hypothetical protein